MESMFGPSKKPRKRAVKPMKKTKTPKKVPKPSPTKTKIQGQISSLDQSNKDQSGDEKPNKRRSTAQIATEIFAQERIKFELEMKNMRRELIEQIDDLVRNNTRLQGQIANLKDRPEANEVGQEPLTNDYLWEVLLENHEWSGAMNLIDYISRQSSKKNKLNHEQIIELPDGRSGLTNMLVKLFQELKKRGRI
jgi:hypothetical protein